MKIFPCVSSARCGPPHPKGMRVQWMENEQRRRGLEHKVEYFQLFICSRASVGSVRGASIAMEATILSSHRFCPRFSPPKPFKIPGRFFCWLSRTRRQFFFLKKEGKEKRKRSKLLLFCYFVIVTCRIVIFLKLCLHRQYKLSITTIFFGIFFLTLR